MRHDIRNTKHDYPKQLKHDTRNLSVCSSFGNLTSTSKNLIQKKRNPKSTSATRERNPNVKPETRNQGSMEYVSLGVVAVVAGWTMTSLQPNYEHVGM